MILAVKANICLDKAEEPGDTPPQPLALLFVLKKMDSEINPIMLDIVGRLAKAPLISYYFTDEETLLAARTAFPALQTHLYEVQQHENRISYVVTVGGDGTILYANRLFQKRTTPEFISIEKGTLGFLCKFRLDEVPAVCAALVDLATLNRKPQWRAESRMRLTCQKLNAEGVVDQRYECLNEVAITKSDEQRQLRLEIYLSDELLTTTAGDGILISTPTGSTAYALSAGGPILHNEVRSILIVPLCPKSLSFRPVCLPAYANLRVKIAAGCKVSAFVSCDGQSSYEITEKDEVQISEAVLDLVSLTSFEQKNHFSEWSMKLNNLLTWNTDYSGDNLDLSRGDSRIQEGQIPKCFR